MSDTCISQGGIVFVVIIYVWISTFIFCECKCF